MYLVYLGHYLLGHNNLDFLGQRCHVIGQNPACLP